MALAFTGPIYTEPDFLPMFDPLKRPLDESHSPLKKIKKEDIYDRLGRNITQQEKRQNNVKWQKVKYSKK